MPQKVLRFKKRYTAAQVNRSVSFHSFYVFIKFFWQLFLSLRTSTCAQTGLSTVTSRTRTQPVCIHDVVLLYARNHDIVLAVTLFESVQVVSV